MKSSGDHRARLTGRSNKIHTGPVVVLPKALLDTDEMRALPASATKLLLAVLPQYNGPGRNNGAIQILMRQPHRYGFRSGSTLTQARDDLLRAGFLQITRQGGKNIPSLYAVTWMGIDKVPGADTRADTMPSHLWRTQNAEQRELPTRDRPKPRVANPQNFQKNAQPAPEIGATQTTTAPVIGTTPDAIAPVIGAVRAKIASRVAPVSATNSCIAMHGVRIGAGVARESDLEIARSRAKQLPVAPVNEFDRARARWQQKRASLARRKQERLNQCQH